MGRLMLWLEWMSALVLAVLVLAVMIVSLFHCILREERRQVNFDRMVADMRIEAKYRAGLQLRGEYDDSGR